MNLITTSIISAIAVTGVLTMVAPSVGATDQTSCIDGSVRSNLKVTWISSNSVTVGTVGSKPLCKDVPVFFSSYTMPDTYNGQPFKNNSTASPQTIFDNQTVVLKKGTTTASAMTIKLPEACKSIQVDVYHGPKIDIVDAKGHGKQYISGKILQKTQDTCAPITPETSVPPVTPVTEAQTPETPAPQVVIPVTPAELPRTGSSAFILTALGSILAVATYAAADFSYKRN
jgi:hypothetical protein